MKPSDNPAFFFRLSLWSPVVVFFSPYIGAQANGVLPRRWGGGATRGGGLEIEVGKTEVPEDGRRKVSGAGNVKACMTKVTQVKHHRVEENTCVVRTRCSIVKIISTSDVLRKCEK